MTFWAVSASMPGRAASSSFDAELISTLVLLSPVILSFVAEAVSSVLPAAFFMAFLVLELVSLWSLEVCVVVVVVELVSCASAGRLRRPAVSRAVSVIFFTFMIVVSLQIWARGTCHAARGWLTCPASSAFLRRRMRKYHQIAAAPPNTPSTISEYIAGR